MEGPSSSGLRLHLFSLPLKTFFSEAAKTIVISTMAANPMVPHDQQQSPFFGRPGELRNEIHVALFQVLLPFQDMVRPPRVVYFAGDSGFQDYPIRHSSAACVGEKEICYMRSKRRHFLAITESCHRIREETKYVALNFQSSLSALEVTRSCPAPVLSNIQHIHVAVYGSHRIRHDPIAITTQLGLRLKTLHSIAT
jgi:hypothetical protein